MNITLRSVISRGDYQKERVTFRCNADTDVGQYLFLQTDSNDGLPTTGVKRTFWFPDKTVRKGDLIVLYTRSGTQSEKVLTTGSKAHFFYWGVPVPAWREDGISAVILHAPEWDAGLVDDLQEKQAISGS